MNRGVCVSVCVCACVCVRTPVCWPAYRVASTFLGALINDTTQRRSEDSFRELLFSFHYVGLGDQTQVTRPKQEGV